MICALKKNYNYFSTDTTPTNQTQKREKLRLESHLITSQIHENPCQNKLRCYYPFSLLPFVAIHATLTACPDTPTCNIAQTVQAVSCNTGSHRYTLTSSSKVQGLYNEQAEQCYTRRDDTKYHKSDRRVVAADVQVEAADTSWSKCVASHDCRFSSPG
ncbi:hypothetical protein ACOSQ2_032105 [Xanthoceras sorbifolium]